MLKLSKLQRFILLNPTKRFTPLQGRSRHKRHPSRRAGPCHLFRFALEQAWLRALGGNCLLRSTARGLVPRRELSTGKRTFGWREQTAICVLGDGGVSSKDDTGRTFYRGAWIGSAVASGAMPLRGRTKTPGIAPGACAGRTF